MGKKWNVAMHKGEIKELDNKIEKLQLSIVYFRPTIRKAVMRGDKVKYQEVAIFLNYIFFPQPVENNLADQLPISWVIAKPTLYPNRIACVDDEVIESWREYTDQISSQSEKIKSGRDFGNAHKGSKVLITKGLFGSWSGTILGPGPRRTVSVEVKMGNQTTKIRLDIDDVKIIG